jgi:ATP-dependent DNA helicase RecG
MHPSFKDKPLNEPLNEDRKDLEKDLESLSKNQRKILEKIKENGYITQETLSKIVGINEKNVRVNIFKLKEKGLLKRIGPAKGGHWKVL